jgi:ketosteroid isomerase-like protein
VDADTVADRIALRDLAEGYASAADRRDRAAFEALFTADATLTVLRPGAEPHTYRGASAIGEIVPQLERYARTFHLVANQACSVAGDRASGEVYCEAHHTFERDGRAIDLVLTIRYDDHYSRAPRGWRIADRTVDILWTAEVELTSGPADRDGD